MKTWIESKGGTGAMDLRMARLCLDCEEIFEAKRRCPRCDSESWHPIMGWIRPMAEASRRVVRRKDILVVARRPQGKLLSGAAL
jgi:hypothetical protein